MKTPFKLGCKPAEVRKNQPQASVMKTLMTRKAPATLVRPNTPFTRMYMNDQIGDCTAAGLINTANQFECVVTNGHGHIEASDQDAATFYSQSTGWDPNDPNTDGGGVEVDVLTKASQNGVAMGTSRYYPIWGSCDCHDQNALALIAQAFGGVYLGVLLAEADQNMDGVWDTTTWGDQRPGSWGGHCLTLYSYDGLQLSDTIDLITWDMRKKATWRWLLSRIMEAHAVAFHQLSTPETLTDAVGAKDWSALIEANSEYLKCV